MTEEPTQEQAIELQQSAKRLKEAFERFLKARPDQVVAAFDSLRKAVAKAEEIADKIEEEPNGS